MEFCVCCRIAVLCGGFGHENAVLVAIGVPDNDRLFRLIGREYDCGIAAFLIGYCKVYRSRRCVCGQANVLCKAISDHSSRSITFVHMVCGICRQSVKGHGFAGGKCFQCQQRIALSEQAHIENRLCCNPVRYQGFCHLNLIVYNRLVCDIIRSTDSRCLYAVCCCHRIACASIRGILCDIRAGQHTLCIGFQYIIGGVQRNIGKGNRTLFACLRPRQGQRFYAGVLIAHVAVAILRKQCEVKRIGRIVCNHRLIDGYRTNIFGVFHTDNGICCGVGGNRIICIDRIVCLDGIALCIGFQQIDIVRICCACRHQCLLHRSQIHIRHGYRGACLPCRNGNRNDVTQAVCVPLICKQCKVEDCVLGFCACKCFIDRNIDGGVRSFYPNADLCRFCNHHGIAEKRNVLVCICKAVPCDIFFAGMRHIAWHLTRKGNHDLFAHRNLHCGIQHDTEVDCIRSVTRPTHRIILSTPVLCILVKHCGFVGRIGRCIIHSHSADCDALNLAECHRESRVSVIARNQTLIANERHPVDDGKVF